MRIRTIAVAGVALALSMGVSACGDDEPAEPAADEEEQAAPAEPATVQTADSGLGTILVDADGNTLYVFDADEDGTSTCYGECEDNWPPLTADAPTAGEGADESLLGTTERDDGSVQVTYDGRPLYFFAGDAAPGDTNGQAVGDVWWVVDAEGAAIEKAAGGGYTRP